MITWYYAEFFKKDYSKMFEVAATIKVGRSFNPDARENNMMYSGNWPGIIFPVIRQYEHEKKYDKPKKIPLKNLIQNDKWWHFPKK